MLETFEQFCRNHEKSITFVGSFSTLAAVVVSLYLARRQTKVKFNVVTGIRKLALQGTYADDHILIRVINVGVATATITGLGWRLGVRPIRRFLEQVPDVILPAGPFPRELATGQQVSFYFPIYGSSEESFNQIAQALDKKPPVHFAAWSVRSLIYANGRLAGSGRIERSLQKELIERHRLLGYTF
jgi:hypothetical protein